MPLEMPSREKYNTFMHYNFMEFEAFELDYAVARLDLRPESMNPHGMAHGGAIYTLADNATGAAAHSDGRAYVTQNSSMHFLRNQTTGVIRAVAKVRHRGKSTVLAAVEILGEGDKLLATGEFSFFCVDQDHLATKRGPS